MRIRSIFYLSLFFCTLAFAQDQLLLENFDKRLTALEQKMGKEKIYNSPARAEVKRGYNLYLFGDALYLMPEENGLEYAIKTNDPTFSLPQEKLDYKNLDFDYDIGFRVGAGVNIPHDSWDIRGVWFHYNTDASGHSHPVNGDALFPIWTGLAPDPGQNPFVLDAHARLRLNINMIDAELGREYYVGKWLSLRPSMAIRTGFIEQHYHILYSPVVLLALSGVEDIKLKNEYWGVGPKAAIDTEWTLGAGFHIYGGAAISLLFGEFEIRKNEVFEGLPLPIVKGHHDFHQVRAIIDINIGIGWNWMLAHDQYHLGLRAGYEQHLYFGQNQLGRVVYNAFNTNVISNLGDLSLQGWVGSLRLDF